MPDTRRPRARSPIAGYGGCTRLRRHPRELPRGGWRTTDIAGTRSARGRLRMQPVLLPTIVPHALRFGCDGGPPVALLPPPPPLPTSPTPPATSPLATR